MSLFGRFIILGVMFIVQLVISPIPTAVADAAPSVEIQEYLRAMIATEVGNQQFICRGQAICTASMIPLFYQRRAFQPCWSRNGRLTGQATELVAALGNAEAEGLRPADYHLYSIRLLLSKLERLQAEGKSLSPDELVDLDLLLTDAFFLYGSHLLKGRINPETIDEQWIAGDYTADLEAILEKALITPQGVTRAFQGLRPPHDDYKRMITALAMLRDIESRGGWPTIGPGFNLHKGMRHREVYALRQRLMLSGDYDDALGTSDNLFDEKLADAVLSFQYRHGLEVDGIVGQQTLAALNVPVESRMRQIKANLERWRWLPHDLGRRYILVNIADFSLKVIDNTKEVLVSRVVVGKPHRSTPVFSDSVEYLVFNPYWYLPETIIVEDVAPSMRANPDYTAQKRIKIFAAGSNETQELDPATIDWAAMSKENIPYKLRQEPGPWNALGRVKIMFPNKFSIYLHDTPSQELFQKTSRDFSSGCIRVEKSVELVSYLLGNDPRWSQESIRATMASGTQQIVSLPEQIPIHILYWTAWGDNEGRIHFRNDLYARDKRLVAALDGMDSPP
ncbi:MAG: L,D-transpeptidase family protein [Proteobacteria bacterium]|nr:L,D-transpeptidase family protein [Pseudomonadota bacterium]